MLNFPLDFAYKKLTKHPYSVKEMKEELSKAGFAAGAIEEAIEQLLGRGYLNDVALALELYDSCMLRKPCGPLLLRQKLKHRKIPGDIIDSILKRFGEEEEFEAITNLVEKHFPRSKKSNPALIARHLQRKGFTEDSVARYLQKRHNLDSQLKKY